MHLSCFTQNWRNKQISCQVLVQIFGLHTWSLNPFFDINCLCVNFFRSHKIFWMVYDKNVCSVNLMNWCFCTPAKHHYIIEPSFMYFSIKERSVALFLLSPVGPFKATTNLRLFNLSIPLINHSCFSTRALLNLRRTITVSLISTCYIAGFRFLPICDFIKKKNTHTRSWIGVAFDRMLAWRLPPKK